MIFQSTLPVWGATVFGGDCQSAHKFQSTLPVWGATDNNLINFQPGVISIHAPRVGSDSMMPLSALKTRDFNPRSPCGERPCPTLRKPRKPGFQSTLPVWGATQHCRIQAEKKAISIHAPRVGSDKIGSSFKAVADISIHAPRVGSDEGYTLWRTAWYDFNPRSPCGERLEAIARSGSRYGISIHAPRVGSDSIGGSSDRTEKDFNPRSPCGERHLDIDGFVQGLAISIHAPRVGSDVAVERCGENVIISIHAPRVGSDF